MVKQVDPKIKEFREKIKIGKRKGLLKQRIKGSDYNNEIKEDLTRWVKDQE